MLFQEGSIAELKLRCMLRRFLHPTVVLQGQFWPCHGFFINHYKSAVFGVRDAIRTRCSCRSIVCRGLCFLVCSTFRFHEMSSSQCYVHQDVALWAMRSPMHHRRWWLMSFNDWAVSFSLEVSGTDSDFYWVLWKTQVSYVCFVDSCVVFRAAYRWFAQCDFMRSLLVLWTFQGTRFTCDDFNWGVECYLWLL